MTARIVIVGSATKGEFCIDCKGNGYGCGFGIPWVGRVWTWMLLENCHDVIGFLDIDVVYKRACLHRWAALNGCLSSALGFHIFLRCELLSLSFTSLFFLDTYDST